MLNFVSVKNHMCNGKKLNSNLVYHNGLLQSVFWCNKTFSYILYIKIKWPDNEKITQFYGSFHKNILT